MPDFAAANDRHRDKRIHLRATSQERDLLMRAALVTTGGDVTRFMMNASLEAATHAIEAFQTSELTKANRRAFYEFVLINPPKPNDALRKLAARPVPAGFDLVDE
jgi:uncharacterized protein (DUF1778 family)